MANVVALIDKNFTAQVTGAENRLFPLGEVMVDAFSDNKKSLPASRHFNHTAFQRLLAETPMIEAEWATLFAYMHRRFGPPNLGGDPYKDLSAGWLLSTPVDQVYLCVSPSLSGPTFSFSGYTGLPIDAFEAPGLQDDFRRAMLTVLGDLTRPVCVRDHLINALGELDDYEGDEEDEGGVELPGPQVNYPPSSGYSYPLGFIGSPAYEKFTTFVHVLREEAKAATGVKPSFNEATETLLQGAIARRNVERQNTPWQLRFLMAALAHATPDDDVGAVFGLDRYEAADALTVRRLATDHAFLVAYCGEGDVENTVLLERLLTEVTPQNIDAAARWVAFQDENNRFNLLPDFVKALPEKIRIFRLARDIAQAATTDGVAQATWRDELAAAMVVGLDTRDGLTFRRRRLETLDGVDEPCVKDQAVANALATAWAGREALTLWLKKAGEDRPRRLTMVAHHLLPDVGPAHEMKKLEAYHAKRMEELAKTQAKAAETNPDATA